MNRSDLQCGQVYGVNHLCSDNDVMITKLTCDEIELTEISLAHNSPYHYVAGERNSDGYLVTSMSVDKFINCTDPKSYRYYYLKKDVPRNSHIMNYKQLLNIWQSTLKDA